MDNTYRLVDTHAHLEEMEDLDSAIERARQSGVVAIVAVGSDYKTNNQVLEIAAKYDSIVYPALGLHPWNIEPDSSYIEHNLQFIEDNIKNAIAIGEVGLDYKKDLIKKVSKELQKEVLASILGIAKRYDKAVTFHSRYAWRDSFTLVAESQVEKVVFHWFTGPINVLRDILGKGYFVSATLAAEYHEEHRRVIKEAAMENLMLETDSPVTYRGHRAEPADVARSLSSVAGLKGLPPRIIADRTTENALKFYGIKDDH